MAKVLWLGDAGCNSGFGRVTHAIGERLVQYGHEVHVLAINYKGDAWPSLLDPSKATPLHLYRPNALVPQDVYGVSRVVEMLGRVEPDVVVMLNDPHVILAILTDNKYDAQRYLLQYRPIISYVPCDGYNLPPSWVEMLPKMTNMIAMSKFGQAAYPGSQLVYHGVDTEVFRPVSEKNPITASTGAVLRTKRECKQAFGFNPDGQLVLRVDKNSGRKDIAATWKAMVPLLRADPSLELHLHCATAEMNSGVNIRALNDREPGIAKQIHTPDFSNGDWPEQDLAALYNAADVFISTSRGEGFGLTLAEAAASGLPIVAQKVSAIPEVAGPAGVFVEPARQITVPSGEDVWLPDIQGFTDAVSDLLQSAGARRELGQAGREHVVQNFNWDVAAARFHEYVTALAATVATDT